MQNASKSGLNIPLLEDNFSPCWANSFTCINALSQLEFSLTESWLFLETMHLPKESASLMNSSKISPGSFDSFLSSQAKQKFLRMKSKTPTLYTLMLVLLGWGAPGITEFMQPQFLNFITLNQTSLT